MANPYPLELRQRVVVAYEGGEGSYQEIAFRFSLGAATVKRWVARRRKRGSLAAQRHGGGTPSTITLEDIEVSMSKLGDPTAGEITADFNRQRRRDARVHVSSMKRALRRHGYVVKKNADGRWRVCALTFRPSAPHTSTP